MRNKPFQSKHPSQPGLMPTPFAVKPLLGLAGALVSGAIALTGNAEAASLTNWRYDATANQLEVTVDAATTPRYFLMAQPARIVLDLPDTEVGDVKVQEAYSGAVRRVRVSQFQPGLTRIVLELAPDVTLAPGQVKLEKANQKGGQVGRDRWILRPLLAKAFAKVPPKTQEPAPPSVMLPVKQPALPTSSWTKPTQVAPAKPPAKLAAPVNTAPTTSKPIKLEVAKPEATPLPTSTSAKPAEKSHPFAKTTPAASKPVQPEAASKPEVVEPGATKPEITRPDAVRPGMPKPGMTNREIVKPPPKPAPDESLVLPASVGSDVNPVTDATAKISVPPPVSLARNQSAGSAQSTPVQDASPQTVAQLPPEATTPLPPDASQPSTGLAIDTSKSTQITVPPPVSVPSNLPDVVVKSSVVKSPVVAAPPAASPQPVTVPAQAVPLPPSSNTVSTKAPTVAPTLSAVPPTAASSGAADIPSTIKILPSTAPRISVPALTPLETVPMQPTAAIPAIAPQPPLVQAPAVTRTTGLQPPMSSVLQPPVSSVMQSPTPNGATPNTIQPPVSSVIQPPVSSVIQAPAPTVTQPSALPSSALPDISNSQSPIVSVPSLQPLAPPLPLNGQSSPVAVPPLQSIPAQPLTGAMPESSPVAPPPTNPANTSLVEFGKPLPRNGAIALNTAPQGIPGYSIAPGQVFQSPYADVLLPTGTVLNLTYPGTTELKLESGVPRQEVLLLQTEVRDAAGNVVFPPGSYVTGRFESDRTGSKFVAQSIAVRDRAIPFSAESESLGGNRELSSTSMLLYSGIGALAGGLISGFSGLGLFGGAAAGATANYFTSPKPAVIQPGQVVQIRVLQDLR